MISWTILAVKKPPGLQNSNIHPYEFLQIDFVLEFGNGRLDLLHRFAPFLIG